jgi:Basic region leucine zipper
MTPRRSTSHQNGSGAGAATHGVLPVGIAALPFSRPPAQVLAPPPYTMITYISTCNSRSVSCRCQEKNRRAQARFRERQKAKAAETGERVAGLEEALQRLQQEKLTLQSHALSLQMQLQQAAQLPAPQPPSLAQPAPPSLDSLVSLTSCKVPQHPIVIASP